MKNKPYAGQKEFTEFEIWLQNNGMKIYTCSKIVEFAFFTLFSIYIGKQLLGW